MNFLITFKFSPFGEYNFLEHQFLDKSNHCTSFIPEIII